MSEREAKVYLALLNKRSATATDLQKISGVPQSKIYEIVGGLIRQGYCTERKAGRKRTFEIINPKVTLNSSFQSLQQRLESSFSLKDELFDLYSTSNKVAEPLEYIEVLRGNENIHYRYCQLVHNAQTELLGFGRRPYACDTEEKSSQQDRESEGVIDRGGIVRWVFELELPDDAWVVKDMKKLQEKGEQFKVAEKLPLKMMIFDRELLLMAEEEPFGPSGELTMSLIKQSTIVNAFYALFEFFWQHSIELKTWEKIQNIGHLR
ncbi:MAG: hypothetical protein GY839_05660 [candidate division Zixibacteria bacterium]|nr:hypothetical protein [candidate division Zixibacteria bacterium]